ncbi:DUF3613 domain-containing protein [Pseudomonas sp. NW5]|uniref:DUF3613 domain-containing protein n=1 Tax=Pseudomonas sp. NW5 TaxID=2934934 RepID=UPI0020218813|nr:DUF3613 domain-containing protein [Pseudomonas sp. NW5]MCL7462320.1 DUF3613 domain-containing protein [Pseudomonas sp. NW5]
MIKQFVVLGALLLPSLAGAATETQGLIAPQPSSQTETWLQLQREGTLASRHAQQLTPAERERAMQRWLDSFEYPIPEAFEQKAGGEVSD